MHRTWARGWLAPSQVPSLVLIALSWSTLCSPAALVAGIFMASSLAVPSSLHALTGSPAVAGRPAWAVCAVGHCRFYHGLAPMRRSLVVLGAIARESRSAGTNLMGSAGHMLQPVTACGD
jgi:hypothetical protein